MPALTGLLVYGWGGGGDVVAGVDWEEGVFAEGMGVGGRIGQEQVSLCQQVWIDTRDLGQDGRQIGDGEGRGSWRCWLGGGVDQSIGRGPPQRGRGRLHDRLESVDGVGRVGDGPDAPVGVDEAVLPLDNIAVPGFSVGLLIPRNRIAHAIVVMEIWQVSNDKGGSVDS